MSKKNRGQNGENGVPPSENGMSASVLPPNYAGAAFGFKRDILERHAKRAGQLVTDSARVANRELPPLMIEGLGSIVQAKDNSERWDLRFSTQHVVDNKGLKIGDEMAKLLVNFINHVHRQTVAAGLGAEETAPRQLCIDFSNVETVAPAIFGEILQAKKALAYKDVALIITGLSERLATEFAKQLEAIGRIKKSVEMPVGAAAPSPAR